MQLYIVVDRFGDPYADPFTREDLAEKLLSIVRQADDEEADIQVIESDPWEAQLNAGLLPFRIGVELFPGTGKVRETKVWPAWPPAEAEGRTSEMETYIEWFVWAKSRSDAIGSMARLYARGV